MQHRQGRLAFRRLGQDGAALQVTRLLPTVARTDSGYRRYSDKEVHTLRFIRRARDLGFSMAEIAELLKLWQNRRRASADVKRIAQRHVADLERRMAAMGGTVAVA